MNSKYYSDNYNSNYSNHEVYCHPQPINSCNPHPTNPCNPQPQPPNLGPCCPDNSYVIGNSIDFTVDKCDSEIKADVTVSYRETVRVWGQITDCNGKPVPYAYLKLVKLVNKGYVGIAHTISDCLGYYQFDICPCKDGTCFRLLVSKASDAGDEKVVMNKNCNPCNPCTTPKPCDCR